MDLNYIADIKVVDLDFAHLIMEALDEALFITKIDKINDDNTVNVKVLTNI